MQSSPTFRTKAEGYRFRQTYVLMFLLCAFVFVWMSASADALDKKRGLEYSFVYLGDMHFDLMTHHDFAWVKADKPNDVRQIEGYVKNTKEYTPGLLRRIQTSIEAGKGRIKMIASGSWIYSVPTRLCY
jgi:hypothetical protein